MRKKYSKKILVLIISILGLGYFFIYRPFTKIKAKTGVVIASAKELKETFSKNDIDLLNLRLKDFSKKYDDLQKEAKTIYWASFIPYVADFKNIIEAGSFLIAAADDSIEAITPYADLIGFKKGGSSFVEKSAEERFQTAVLTLDKVLVKIDTISENIRQAELRIYKINPNR